MTNYLFTSCRNKNFRTCLSVYFGVVSIIFCIQVCSCRFLFGIFHRNWGIRFVLIMSAIFGFSIKVCDAPRHLVDGTGWCYVCFDCTSHSHRRGKICRLYTGVIAAALPYLEDVINLHLPKKTHLIDTGRTVRFQEFVFDGQNNCRVCVDQNCTIILSYWTFNSICFHRQYCHLWSLFDVSSSPSFSYTIFGYSKFILVHPITWKEIQTDFICCGWATTEHSTQVSGTRA